MPPYPTHGLEHPRAARLVHHRGLGRNGGADQFGSPAQSVSYRVLSVGRARARGFVAGRSRRARRARRRTDAKALGSNNWVVDGTMTRSGKPLLANDPHLGTRLPSTWYLAHMSAGDFDVIGATLPGAPAVALGRNRFIAWGATNVAADVAGPVSRTPRRQRHDSPSSEARTSRSPSSPKPFVVKGAEPLRIDVRITRHGPLVSDAINANNAGVDRDAASRRRSSRWRFAGRRSIRTTIRSPRSSS